MCSIRFSPALLRLMGLAHPSWAAAQAVGTATSNETGGYSIVNLRPRRYAVTFTLPGWERAEENL